MKNMSLSRGNLIWKFTPCLWRFSADHVTDGQRGAGWGPSLWRGRVNTGKGEHGHRCVWSIDPDQSGGLTVIWGLLKTSKGISWASFCSVWLGGGRMRCLVTETGVRMKAGQPSLWVNVFRRNGPHFLLLTVRFKYIVSNQQPFNWKGGDAWRIHRVLTSLHAGHLRFLRHFKAVIRL